VGRFRGLEGAVARRIPRRMSSDCETPSRLPASRNARSSSSESTTVVRDAISSIYHGRRAASWLARQLAPRPRSLVRRWGWTLVSTVALGRRASCWRPAATRRRCRLRSSSRRRGARDGGAWSGSITRPWPALVALVCGLAGCSGPTPSQSARPAPATEPTTHAAADPVPHAGGAPPEGARLLAGPGNRNAIYLCEQAAEKVIRAVLTSEATHAGIEHQLQEMVDLVPDANPLKALLRDIEYLTAYARATDIRPRRAASRCRRRGIPSPEPSRE